MIPERYGPATHALMRMAFALIFLNYGLQKFGLFGGIDGHGGTAPLLSWPFGVAGVIETVAGTLILIGLWTRLRRSSPAAKWRSPISGSISSMGLRSDNR